MGKHQGFIFNQFSLGVAVVLGLFSLVVAVWPLSAMAQSGCSGDPCVFDTPTGTITPLPTATPLTGTPTAVPMPSAVPFPEPNYNQPTSIPPVQFPDLSPPLNPTIEPLPSPWSLPTIAPPVTGSTNVDISAINTTLNISYTAPLSLSAGSSMTATETYSAISGVIGAGQGIITDVTSYTTWISGEIVSMQYTETITITNAPTWYAPQLPREFAAVGWTFEQQDARMYSVSRYSLNTWSSLFGYMAALPFRLAKNMWELFRFMGPFGLFLIWLLAIMLPTVFGFRLLQFLKMIFIRVVNFILEVLLWIWRLIQLIPFI